MADQGLFQSGQHRHALLAQGRQIASDAAKDLCTSQRAEAAGNLLLHFDHPKIPLREAIVKRHSEVLQEAQHGVLVLGKAIEQIARCRLFAPTFLTGLWWW